MQDINKLIGAMLAIVVGVAVLPAVTGTIDDALYDAEGNLLDSVPPVVETLVDLLPILFVVIVVVGAVGYIRWRQ